jgi:glycosyltransferase involved in cell wall biosynthesis
MITTCLINNYNYARYLPDAVESALAQTHPFDEIIVADDGSTDDSLAVLRRRFGHNPTVQIVAKKNEGQLSCFNEGFARSRGDIVFFLDADDVYEPNYVAEALAIYDRDPAIDFVFCGTRQFGKRDKVRLLCDEDRDLGYSVILTALLHEWIGGPTSSLSMRRQILEKLLPLPFIDRWRTRADDCLVFGASLAGARKYYLAEPLVRYRVHDANGFCGQRQDAAAVYRRRLAVNVLFEYLKRQLCLDQRGLAEFHHREFSTIPRPTLRQLRQYMRVNRYCVLSLSRRIGCLAEMIRHFAAARIGRKQSPAAALPIGVEVLRKAA